MRGPLDPVAPAALGRVQRPVGRLALGTAAVCDLGFEREVRVAWLWNDTSHISPPPLAIEH